MAVRPNSVLEQALQRKGQLIQWRRTIHANPELSFREFETAELVASTLKTIPGMNVTEGVAKTGVVGTVHGSSGPTLAIRADMDALPIQEEAHHDYRSRRDGVMHACGHDAHTAILLGVAHIVAEMFNRGEVNGTVKFLFQPAEEAADEDNLTGAPHMIRAGVLKDVDAAIALHVSPEHPVGVFLVHDGYSMANVDVFRGVIRGTGGHAAYPHLGRDPLWMLGPFLQALYGIVTRRVSPLEPAVVSVTRLHTGTASNVLPKEVVVEGTVRSYKPETREQLVKEVETAFSVVKTLGGEYSLDVFRGEPALYNAPTVNALLTESMRELFPDCTIQYEPFGLGGEDFGHVTEKVPGAMFFLGCARDDGVPRPLHTPSFDIDENCLPIGAAILALAAKKFLTTPKRREVVTSDRR